MAFLNFLKNLFDRLFVVVGAFMGAQIPEFMQQYRQRLAGHVAELNRLLDNFRQIAQRSNKTLSEYIGKFMANDDLDFSKQGELMQSLVLRYENLNQALVNLTTSSAWKRPYYFFSDLQMDIAEATFQDFQPGINVTGEGIVYLLLGAILGFGIFQLILWFCRLLTRLVKRS